MGDLEDGQRVVVDSEGEGILGEFTFRGEQFDDAKPENEPAAEPQRRSQLTSRLTTPLPPRRRLIGYRLTGRLTPPVSLHSTAPPAGA